jgi:hypothetical protein
MEKENRNHITKPEPKPVLPDVADKSNPYSLVWYNADWSEKKTALNNAKYWEWEVKYNGFGCP